ncbi:hypothetical protein RXV86_10490 [Alisedimentitalea sp. MJ-SS2]|uniref:hypothetical protein n=1 Tax=Aliisedimentitalea sp. MJ-SS2 TaxID=3049795 RepID=UPI00290D0BA8|nr:hypothetical protein [Alisedimentitalea sp. MJ-SS2]MDU8927811.1 hypothetical protein [Alisedimentitalea sp. MJ-SS2]
MNELLEYVWHDTVLLKIEIDRSDPGENDTFRILVEWSDWEPRPECPYATIEFKDCHWLNMDMNFGVVCVETFDQIELEPDHPEIQKIAKLFRVEDLTCVAFKTNSTGSTIRIIAESVTIMPHTTLNGVA